MSDTDTVFPFNRNGKFTIGTGLPGAPLLEALLTVPGKSLAVMGQGVLTQATNPPLHAPTAFQGIVIQEEEYGSHQIYTLEGSPMLKMLGAPFVNHAVITLEKIWGTTGKATYTYIEGGRQHEVASVPVKVTWLPQE